MMSTVHRNYNTQNMDYKMCLTQLYLYFVNYGALLFPRVFALQYRPAGFSGFSVRSTLLRSSAQLHAAEASISKHFDGVSYVHLYSVSMCDLNLIVGANFLGFSGDCDDWNKGHKTLLTNNKEPSKLK